MVSIAEAREQIEALKREVDSLSMSYHELREVETTINRTLIMLEQATGSKDVAHAINLFQKTISVMRMLQITLHALMVAEGPLGWAMFLTSAAMTGTYIANIDTGMRTH